MLIFERSEPTADAHSSSQTVLKPKFSLAIISSAFVTVSHFHPSLIFFKTECTLVEHFIVLHAEGRLQALPVNIKQVCKWLVITNALAYNNAV